MPPKNKPNPQDNDSVLTSTSYSRERYAHPFFLPVPASQRQALNGQTNITEWSKQQLGPIPAVRNGGRLSLSDVIGAAGAQEIERFKEIRFHALGDTGVGHATSAQVVADDMATDYKPGAGALNPAFLFHLGDVIYGTDKETHYVERFYSPYKHYPGKIIAIPGNHDGEALSTADQPSLSAFRANFCTTKPVVPKGAAQSGIYRETMTLPGAYWLLDTPFVRIIGLYSSWLENPGYLTGITSNKPDNSQLAWLADVLVSIAKAKDKKGLIIATHHPPYSKSGHSGSVELSASIDEACKKAGIFPDLFLSGHAHNYQRYTRAVAGKQIAYVVAGTGGMPRQPVVPATGQPVENTPGVTYEASVSSLGYLYVTASVAQIQIEFWQQGAKRTKPSDSATINLQTGRISSH
ncbi:MAG: metallophosphoesterase family protein [Bryobacteraceae bacterium]